ncbi:histidine--tRNA ligase family protein, partial [Halobacterium salinarum]|nr:histidine--tRNA ligase family protein [Halobacterium salinarum]
DDLDALVSFAGTDRVRDAVANLRNVLDAAETLGVRQYCDVSLTTARGLDYYTGVVFECFDSTGDVGRAVFGGGRYDDLIERFGGQPTPAVGVAPGHATLNLLLENAGVLPDDEFTPDYYVLQVGDTDAEAADVASALRERGNRVDTDITGRSFGAQMNYADNVGADTVVIVGEQDLADGNVTIKNMASGEQTTAPIAAFHGAHDAPRVEDFA